jgi:PAS domain S-box-containing protein
LTPELVDARAVIDALPRALVVTSPDGRILLWNARAETLYGWTEAEVLGRPVRDVVVPVDGIAEADAIMAQVLGGRAWQGDFSVVRRNGDTMRVFVVDRPIVGPDGEVVAIVGASEDVTDQRLAEQQVSDVAAHLALALDAGDLGTWRWDRSTGEVIWDARLEALYGLREGTFPGTYDAYVALLHPEDAPSVLDTVRRAVDSHSRYTVEHRVIWPDGSVHWLQGKGQVTLDGDGNVTGTMGCVADVTEQMLTLVERDRAITAAIESAERERMSARRLAFLAAVNDALAVSASTEDVMRNVARAAVPTLGEWCAMYVVPDDADQPLIEVAHADPQWAEHATRVWERFPFDRDAPSGVANVLRTGEAEFYADINDVVRTGVASTEGVRALIQELALQSEIVVPLTKNGHVLGALQLVNTRATRAYSDDDLTLATAVASRIASTLENRRLAEQQRRIAITLQQSLLPDALPDIPALDLAVRYWAAGEGSVVGGDFYDVFAVRDGVWALVIGDVCGRGPLAAALTGLARHTVRTAAWNGAVPDDVLAQLNRAVLRSGQRTFCTAVYAEVRVHDDGIELRSAAGGHPLPVVVRAGGEVMTLGEPGTVLGMLERATCTIATTVLGPGDTIVLYTDGITDVRPPHDLSPDAVQTMCKDAAGERAAEDVARSLGEAVARVLSFEARNDDIALLVARVVG